MSSGKRIGMYKGGWVKETGKIKTERLLLEATNLDDRSKELSVAIHEANEFEWYFGIEETEERLDKLSIVWKYFYNIFDGSRNFVGYVGVHQEEETWEIEIYIIKKYRRQGYARETLMRVMELMFCGELDGIPMVGGEKIVAEVRKENIASRRLMEDCGFIEDKEKGLALMFLVNVNEAEMGTPIGVVNYYLTREIFGARAHE